MKWLFEKIGYDPDQQATDDCTAVANRRAGEPLICSMAWVLAKTAATGRQAGGIIPYPAELRENNERLHRLLDVAEAGGWKDRALMGSLIGSGEATAQLEHIAREAGKACAEAPDQLQAFLEEEVGRLMTPTTDGTVGHID